MVPVDVCNGCRISWRDGVDVVDIWLTGFVSDGSVERSIPERSPSKLDPPTLELVEAEEIAWTPLKEEATAVWLVRLDREPVLCPIELLLFKGSKSSSSSANMSSESSCSSDEAVVVGW